MNRSGHRPYDDELIPITKICYYNIGSCSSQLVVLRCLRCKPCTKIESNGTIVLCSSSRRANFVLGTHYVATIFLSLLTHVSNLYIYMLTIFRCVVQEVMCKCQIYYKKPFHLILLQDNLCQYHANGKKYQRCICTRDGLDDQNKSFKRMRVNSTSYSCLQIFFTLFYFTTF